jgi:hypothetical protein
MAYGIGNAASSNMNGIVADVLVGNKNTDAVTGDGESFWQNTYWPTYWGYFNTIPELKSALLMKATWDVGKGYIADAATTVILDHISGWGKDTFLDILFNMDLISRLAGDAFAEIIRDPDTDTLLNLKVLDPGSIKIICDNKGIIKRYEQMSKIPGGTPKKFEPEEIFHISHNRLADQIHGISDIVSMEQTILAELENFTDIKKIMHRFARPMIIFKVGTDNPTALSGFIAKMDAAVNKGENIYIPNDKNTLEYEVVKVDIGASVMAWRDDIRNKFYRTLGLPLIVFGSSGSTESGGKIEYLAHEQVFSHDQRFLEEQVWNQLYLRIKLNSPVTLLENLQQDQSKDANQGLELQPNDVTAGSGA